MIGWIAGGVVLVIAGLVGSAILVGLTLPVKHAATSRVVVPCDAPAAFGAITDWAGSSRWRPGISRVDLKHGAHEGRDVWVEHNKHGTLAGVVELVEPPIGDAPGVVRTRIIEQRAFGGTWTYRVTPQAGGTTEVRVTENGEVYNPIFRLVSRFVMGHHATTDAYLKALAAHLGAPDAPVEHAD